MNDVIIIIGASHAGSQLAISLRQEGGLGKILLIGDEPEFPYHRPPLSKDYLKFEFNTNISLLRSSDVYEKLNIDLQLGKSVLSINRATKCITFEGGDTESYDKLAICTGSRVNKVSLPGSDLKGIHYLRKKVDAESIKADLDSSGVITDKKVVIIGGGYIGLETSASLRKSGVNVTILEMAPRILARVAAPQISQFYTRIHQEEGITIKTDVSVCAFEGKERVNTVVCTDNSRYEADLVIIGVGIKPNIELAEQAGLTIENGIVVDEHACTSDPDIFAAGDVTFHPNSIYHKYLRLESVPNAIEQAKVAAANMCGNTKNYKTLPWFWSDQFDVKLQIAGVSQHYDQVILRGDSDQGRSFTIFYLKAGRLIASDCVNRPKEFMISKQWITREFCPNPEKLANESIALNTI